jgi:FMN phosphatase YigB (HAD superfamily)
MSTAATHTILAPVGGVPEPVSSASPLAGIMLDVPDVLYDATLWQRWLFQLLVRMGAAANYAEFVRAWSETLVDVHRGRREYTEALQSFLLQLGLSWAQVDEIEAASRIQRRTLELDVRPLPGATRVIEELNRRKIPLVAWADTPHSAAKWAERLERIVPRAHFSAVLTSFDLECAQPAELCYRAALDVLDHNAGEVLYVGHDTQHLAAAARAGMRTAAVNFAANAQANHLLMRLEELLAVVDRPAAVASRTREAAAPSGQSGAMSAQTGNGT